MLNSNLIISVIEYSYIIVLTSYLTFNNRELNYYTILN